MFLLSPHFLEHLSNHCIDLIVDEAVPEDLCLVACCLTLCEALIFTEVI